MRIRITKYFFLRKKKSEQPKKKKKKIDEFSYQLLNLIYKNICRKWIQEPAKQ